MTEARELLPVVRELQRGIRDRVVAACASQSVEKLSDVANDDEGDTIYAIDKVGEQFLVDALRAPAKSVGGIELVAEGLPGGQLSLPPDRPQSSLRWRLIVDPIDGTRGLMYQKRSAWVLSALAPNRGPETRLSDVVFAVQTEIPTLKQHLSDELWAFRGQGVSVRRYNRLTGERVPLAVAPSSAATIEHGYAMLSRFFPGVRQELAAMDEEIVHDVLGPSPAGKALCFEEQYASSGGQLYELLVGHDRFNADLRAIMGPVFARRGLEKGLCCHPYDLCTALIAQELGVLLTDARGGPLDMPLDVHTDVAWVGYANSRIREQVEPALQRALSRRGLL